MLRRSLTHAASKRVLGVHFRPRVHALVISQSTQSERPFGRVQRAAFSTGEKGWNWGSGGGTGPDEWVNIVSDWFEANRNPSILRSMVYFDDERDLRDEMDLGTTYTPGEIEALAERIEKRVRYVYAITNERQREGMEVFTSLALILRELAHASRTKSHLPIGAYFLIFQATSVFMENRPVLLISEADMQMLNVLCTPLRNTLQVATVSILLNKLKLDGCTSSNVATIHPKALGSKMPDANICFNTARWIIDNVGLAPERWFSVDDEKLLLILAGRLRQAGEKMSRGGTRGAGFVTYDEDTTSERATIYNPDN